ncbi:MAG TPA: hypothetical protein VFC60_01595 [Tissierellaceae bacterium]|nr:hypothetical protein [Tissierellaceae bacterium]
MSFDEYEINYRDYEERCNEIRKENENYLEEFIEDLRKAGLKEKTIGRHFQNIHFYLNIYLLRQGLLDMSAGADSSYIEDFLGNFFIRKCMWSTPATIKSNGASMKKFYKSMFERGYIDKSDYNEVIGTISFNMEFWIEDCEAYNDPNSPNPFSMF